MEIWLVWDRVVCIQIFFLVGKPSGHLPKGRWNWPGWCSWWTAGALSVEPANIMLFYCVVLSAVSCLKVHRCLQRCGVLFLKLWYFSLVYSVWHSAVFVYTAWLLVYDRSQDGRRIAEGGSSSHRICHLLPSLLPSSFFPPRIGLISGGRMDGRSLGVVRNFHSIQIWCLAVALLYIGRAGLQQNEGNSLSGCLVIFSFRCSYVCAPFLPCGS